MRGTTRVFEGRDISTITSSSFHSVNGHTDSNINGNGNGKAQPHVLAPYGGMPSPISLPSIGNGRGFPGYEDGEEEEEDEDGEEQQQQQQQREEEGPRVRRRRLGSGTRLPGLAELDRSIAAGFAAAEGGRLIKQEEPCRRIKHEQDRRGSGGSGGSGASRRSR